MMGIAWEFFRKKWVTDLQKLLETNQWLVAVAFINPEIEHNNQGTHLFSFIWDPYAISIRAAYSYLTFSSAW